jgi:hypothetical protein
MARRPQNTTALGKTLEDKVEKDYNGRRSASSGAAAGRKGDVQYTIETPTFTVEGDHHWMIDFDYLAECKVTEAKSFSLKKETWDKIKAEAEQYGRRPSMFIRFYDHDTGKHTDLVVRDVNDDLEMLS